jgi:predicted kinase
MRTVTVYVTCGPPGAGKSTWAQRQAVDASWLVLSVHEYRGQAPGPGQPSAGSIYARLDAQFRRALADRTHAHVVIDTCALQDGVRQAWLRIARQAGARCELVMLRADSQLCRARDASRPQPLPPDYAWTDAFLRAQLAYVSAWREGWDAVQVVRT